MPVSVLLAVSVLLQLTAAALALRLIRVTGRRWAWLLIATAILLMAVRRSIVLGALWSGHSLHAPDVASEWVALGVSALILAGVALLSPLFRSSRRSEEALRESEQKYRMTLESMGDAIHVVDSDLRITLFNSAFEQWCEELQLGGDATGSSVFQIFPFLPDRVREEYRRVFETGEVLATEESVVVGDQEIITETRKIPISEGGRVTGVVTVVHDVTERRQAEENLQKEKDFCASMLNSLPGTFYVLDEKGKFLRWNVTLERITGYTGEEISQMSPLDFLIERDKKVVAEKIREVFSKGQAEVEATVLTKAGGEIPFYLTGLRHEMAEGTFLLGMGIDVTERQRLEEQLRQAQKMEAVGLLAGGLAHDFNNILTTVLGNVELMGEHLAGDPDGAAAGTDDALRKKLREGLAQIEWAGHRAASLTRQLLVFSRRQIIQPQVLDLNHVLSDMEDMLRRLIGEDVHLGMDLEADLGRIRADVGQIEQVVMNLAVNARDAMQGGGKLEITTENVALDEEAAGAGDPDPDGIDGTGPHVLLTVSDTGCGMDKETLGHIFEPFFTTKQLGKGTGLGLATVFGIVRQSSGGVRVQSEPQHGTTFRIYWPQVEEAAAEPAPTAPAEEAPKGRETILIAEDEYSVRQLTCRILEARGYVVLCAENGRRAIERAEQHEEAIHLLISDLIMPDMDGLRLSETLIRARPEIKVLYLSGYTSSAIADRGVLKEGVEFLQKPFSGEVLARRVREILDKSETHAL